MIIIKNYQIYFKKNYYVLSGENTLCPSCNGKLTVRDSRKREVKDSNGAVYVFALRRLYCRSCNQLHLEIPDCIEPQKHYFKATIQSVVNGECECFAGDNRTISRWKKK